RIATRPAKSAECFEMPIRDAGLRQRLRQSLCRKMRMTPRSCDAANVGQLFDVVRLQHRDEFFERPSGMADGIDHVASGFRLRPSGVKACATAVNVWQWPLIGVHTSSGSVAAR